MTVEKLKFDNERQALSLIELVAQQHGPSLAISTSFGIQSAAMLHMATRVVPKIPVIWIDTGYLPDETYKFADELTDRLGLNLKTYQAALSPARMEARHGKLWEKRTPEAIDLYHQIRKVEPMKRALDDLHVTGWLAGLRAQQTDHRKTLSETTSQFGRDKYLPILKWSTRDVHAYLKRHNLPLHPLFYDGYSTVGDWHMSRATDDADQEDRGTRFFGLKEECGLHTAA